MSSVNSTKNHLTVDRVDTEKFIAGDVAFVIISSIVSWMIVPGCGFAYNGGGREKNGLTMLMVSFWVMATVFIQWWAIGYSLVFGTSTSSFIGGFDKIFLWNVYDKAGPLPAKAVPELAFCLYQGVTSTLAPGLIFGTIAERGRMLPAIVFCLAWTTFVYDFVAHWSLNPDGWAFKLQFLDFGGGAPIHVPVSAAAIAYSYILGRKTPTTESKNPHNMSNVALGTVLVWFASFGYNSGSAYRGGMVATMATLCTNLSASAGGIVWGLLDFYRTRKVSAFGFCLGIICGLVAIIPSSGFINASSSVIIGSITSAVCYFVSSYRDQFIFEDVMDVFVVNGIGGVMGNLLTGVFAQKSFGGKEVGKGGWIDGHWLQVPYQIANTVATFTYSFVLSFIFLFFMNKIKCLKLRVSLVEEEIGTDQVEFGLKCYEFGNSTECKMNHNSISTIHATSGIGIGHLSSNENNRIENNRTSNNSRTLKNNWTIN